MDGYSSSGTAIDERLKRIAEHLLRCPTAAAFDPVKLATDLWPHLYVVDLLPLPDVAERGLRIRLTGSSLDTMFGRRLVGQRLDQILHGPHSAEVVAGFQRCATTREPVWMRQVVAINARVPRYIEGVAVYLSPERIYGGLLSGEIATTQGGFEMRVLGRD